MKLSDSVLRRWWTASVLVCFLTVSSGCAYLSSVSVTRVPKDRGTQVEAESWTWGIFGIFFSNDFVDEAVEDLREKCRDGYLSGVYTKTSGRIFILWATRTVTVKAYCVRSPIPDESAQVVGTSP